jgi:uncharacterized protein involved in outer membrane biogenesis
MGLRSSRLRGILDPRRLVPRRRAHWVTLGVLLLLVGAWFVVPQLFVPMIRGKLQGMISGKLDARLQMGRLMYAPPFGVRARDVRLIGGGAAGADTAGTELLKVRRLDLKLARSPFRKGPLVIQNITVTDPEVHLIRTADGRLVGMHAFVRSEADEAPATQPAAPPSTQPNATTQPAEEPDEADPDAARAKLSDMFELRHFGIEGGRIVYEDRSKAGLPPVVWKDINVGMETTRQSKSLYGYTLNAENRDLAKLNASGTFDLDALLLDVGSLHVEAQAHAGEGESPLPAQVQQVLKDYRVEGRVTLDADGHVAVRDLASAAFRASLELRDGSAYSPQWDATLDRVGLKLSVDSRSQADPATAARGPLRLYLENFEAASGDTTLRLDKAAIALDRAQGTWAVEQVAGQLELGRDKSTLPKRSRPVLAGMGALGTVDFTVAAGGALRPGPGRYVLAPEDLVFLVYPRGVRLQPPKTPAAIENLGGGGSVRKEKGTRVVVAQDLTFSYGGDAATLTSARLALPPRLADLKDEVRIEEISGGVEFRRPGPRYPGKFGRVIERLRPVGTFTVGRDSWYAVTKVEPPLRARTDPAEPPRTPPHRKGDWFFSVATDDGSFTLTKHRIELNHMTGDATVSNMVIDVRRLEADVFGGRLSGTTQITPGGSTKYQGRAFLRGADLTAVSKTFILPEMTNAKLTGVGNLNIEFAGERPRDGSSPLDALRAAGEFEVFRGQFWTIPVLGEIAKRAGGGREMTVGEAAGVFEVADRRILLRQAAVSSPALGVQGSGAIGFDKQLDLNIVAAPLGDWRDKLKATNVPVVSDVAGEVAGALQTLVNTATRGLLYEFRVTGPAGHPQFATVPVPALTDAAAALFGGMLGEQKEGRLLESVRGGRATRGKERTSSKMDQRPGAARSAAHAGS